MHGECLKCSGQNLKRAQISDKCDPISGLINTGVPPHAFVSKQSSPHLSTILVLDALLALAFDSHML